MDSSLPSARARIDHLSLACLTVIVIGWFGMNTLVSSVGPLTQAVRFYQMLAVVRHPGLIFMGVGDGHALETGAFTLLCLLALVAPLAPAWSARRGAWLAGLLPLALMLACFAVLYSSGASTWQPDPSSPARWFGDGLVNLANGTMARLSAHVASHVSVGWGCILALLASTALSVRSALRYRAARGSTPASADLTGLAG